MRIKVLRKTLALSLLAVASLAVQAAEIDQGIPEYERTRGVSGNLSSVGSDTLANLMTLWAEDFKRVYPNVNIQIQAAGSSTAPPALTERTSTIGPMSREMKDNEIEAFESRFGYKPTAIPVAIDALAVYVHKDNPIPGMTIPQIDAIFSSNQRCGESGSINSWGELEMKGAWERRDIQLFGRNSVSGTYGYFKDVALCDGDFKNTVNEQPGSASVVQSVSTSLNGIGYSGIGYRTSSVRAVPIAKSASSEFFEATPENSVSGSYPLARFLYVYVNKEPNKPLPPLEREFVKLILSKTGQEVVLKDGYIPLPGRVVQGTMRKLQLD
ncbi:MAG: phosphate-binding protein [SAR86 cluster bacterium]|uniref:Phosphate-binding protein n=1 Tax=SAR86 cluster bacterium TaxID=2030880 RepID=A0A2A4X5G3_9GAMM|nr:MAG: phosphate-binding protein [SAR86 cluster bacterium]